LGKHLFGRVRKNWENNVNIDHTEIVLRIGGKWN
jgi:hypothetical protein